MPTDSTYTARPTVRIAGQALPLLSANIARMAVRERQGGLSSLELALYDVLSFGDGSAGYGATAGSPLQLGVDIAIYAGDTESPQEIFHGTVTAIEAEAGPHTSPLFTMLAEDRLWNTGVFVAPVATLLELGRRRLPRLSDRLARIAPVIDSAVPSLALQAVCTADPATNLSRDVFRASSPELAVSQLPLTLRWSDWATPERVIHTLHEVRATPAWVDALTRGGVWRGAVARRPVDCHPRTVQGRRP